MKIPPAKSGLQRSSAPAVNATQSCHLVILPVHFTPNRASTARAAMPGRGSDGCACGRRTDALQSHRHMTRCVVGGHIGRLGSAVASIWSFSGVETSRCFGVVQRRRSASRGHLESSTFKEGAGSTEFADLSTLVFEECRRARRLGRIGTVLVTSSCM